MTEAAEKKQKLVVGRMVNGELHVIGEVVPFVSSRLGPDVSHETKPERDVEADIISRCLAWREGTA